MDKVLQLGYLLMAGILLVQNWEITKLLKQHEEELQEHDDRLEKGVHETEQRCQHCLEREHCPAYDTGTQYPCPYFEEDSHG